MATSSRRALLGAAAALTAAPLAAAAAPPADLDAELVRVCHEFAEAEYRNWWRYIVTPAHLADAQDRDPDWATLEWIETTPATTPAGWHAKALAYSSWWREAYDGPDGEADTDKPLLASLLRDMVAPARAAILMQCEAEYGPLGEGYSADWRWVGRAPAAEVAAPQPIPLHLDAELLAACHAFTQAEAEVTRLERIADDDVFEAAVTTMHEATVRVSGLRAHTMRGLWEKAAVARTVLAADEPAVVAAAFGDRVQRHDVLAWSTLADLVEATG